MALALDRCYVFVKAWKASAACVRSCEDASALPDRECRIVESAETWDATGELPPASGAECALVICGCAGHPSEPIQPSRCNAFWINKAFLDVEAGC